VLDRQVASCDIRSSSVSKARDKGSEMYQAAKDTLSSRYETAKDTASEAGV